MTASPPIALAVAFDESPFPGTTEPWVAAATLAACDPAARTLADGATTNGSATLTSASGAFTSVDVGRAIAGAGIPALATIAAVGSATSITLSAQATATATGLVVTISTVDLPSVALAATEILRLLSGRKYGIRRGTVRPHRMVDQFQQAGVAPVPTGWPFGYGVTGGMIGYDADSRQLILDGPANILGIKVDGNSLVAATDWALYDRRLLVRMQSASGSSLGWPLDQRLDLPDTATGTWSVTYESGIPVTPGGRLAAKAYACQLVKLLSGASGCVLPDRVTNVTRQGVTISRGSLKESLDDGRTGISAVDQWLAAVNPNKLRRRARIAGPESYTEARLT